MIEFTKSYKTGDGQVFGSIEEAQLHEVENIFNGVQVPYTNAKEVARVVLKNRDILVDVLTTTPTSKPKARASHGGTKNRTRKTVITNATVSVPSDTTINVGAA